MWLKFALGLFDQPFVDEEAAKRICKSAEHEKVAEEAMRRSLVLLKKDNLPLASGLRIYAEGFTKEQIEAHGKFVLDYKQAEIAIIRLNVPKYPDHRDPMAMMFESGALVYPKKIKEHCLQIMKEVPTVLVINLNRQAILGELGERAVGVLAEFNVKPEILLQALFGQFSPSGQLPFSLPQNMQTLENHPSDTPLTEKESSFYRGFGETY